MKAIVRTSLEAVALLRYSYSCQDITASRAYENGRMQICRVDDENWPFS